MKNITKKVYEKSVNFIKNYYKDIIFLIILFIVAFVKLPYVVYKPGGAIDLSGRINVENSYENKGNYSMNYVSVAEGNIPTLLCSFLMKDWDIVKMNEVTYNNLDYSTTFRIEQIDYENSIATATLNAYKKAGLSYKIISEKGTILYIDEKANTNLEVLDEIISVDDIKYTNLDDLKKYLNSLEVGTKVILKVKNNDKEYERYAVLYDNEGDIVMGVSIYKTLDYETDPKIEIKSKSSEAGSSGGLMLTLAIYDAIIEKDLTHGLNIMGTGTIDDNNNVGEIGGVKYKLLGAEKMNADIFFVPEENYKEAKEVYKKYKLSFDLVKVKTLDDAINYLEQIK